MKKALAILLAALMVFTFIAACAGDTATDTAEETTPPETVEQTTQPPEDTTDEAADETQEEIDEADDYGLALSLSRLAQRESDLEALGPIQRGGHITIVPASAAGVAPIGLPWDVNPADAALIEPFTHGLTAQYLDGRTRLILSAGYEVVVNGDGTYTIIHTIRDGVVLHPHSLHPAEPVDADLIVWVADRMQYYSAWPTGMIDVYAVDEMRVAFVWNQLRNATPSMTTAWVTSRLIYETYGVDALAETPISAGPFRVIQYDRGQQVIFERFDGYFREGRPFVDGLTLTFLDRLTQGLALRTEGEGRVHAVRTLGADFAAEFIAEGFDIITMDNITIVAVLPNDDPENPLANPLVRRAVSHAIDRDTITSALGFGVHQPTLQHIPAGWGGHNDTPGYGAPPFNIEAGRALMVEAGFSADNPLVTTLIPRPGLVAAETHGVVIQAMLREIYIEAELDIMDVGAFTAVRQTEGWTGILLCAYISWMNPEDSGRANFEHIANVDPQWVSLVPSQRLLDLIEDSMFFGDVVPAVMEISDYILDDDFLWIIPLWTQGMITILSPELGGWLPLDHMYFTEDLWLQY